MTDREIMQQAYDAMNDLEGYRPDIDKAMLALHQALAQPEQEPVAWIGEGGKLLSYKNVPMPENIPVYAAPSRKPWVGLTDDEIKEVLGLNETPWSLSGVALQHVMDDVRALEAKLKEKNGG